jgi:succinate-semialdehyde dehydrogenase / glutarate-semialdehyde dehydrogenase
VTGPGPELGPVVVDVVDHVMFTGSTPTGRAVGQRAAARLIGASLELGGKNPMIVLADADLGRTVEGAVRACFSNAGQLCISMERIYVERPAHDEFLRRFAERVRGMALGAGFDYRTEMGSLQSKRQLATVAAHVEDAVAKGATVVTGGRPRSDLGPCFYEPTILTGVTPEMACAAEETFGPVVAVHAVRDADEAVELANASPYGLNASVWSRDLRRARAIARRVRAGTVNVNEGYGAAWASTDAPMGGMGDSGLGRRHGAEGILGYTEAQTVAVQRGVRLDPMLGMSYERWAALVVLLMRALRRAPR